MTSERLLLFIAGLGGFTMFGAQMIWLWQKFGG